MVHRSKIALPLLLTCAMSAATCCLAQPASQDQSTPAPDNSARNKQQDTTADKQPNSAEDRETARKIRKSVVADKSLSIYAHNVKIIVAIGQVSLRGPVNSEEEKKKIGNLAAQVAGSSDKVVNDISVKAGS